MERVLVGVVICLTALVWPTSFVGALFVFALIRMCCGVPQERIILATGLALGGLGLLGVSLGARENAWSGLWTDPLFQAWTEESFHFYALGLWHHKWFLGGVCCLMSMGCLILELSWKGRGQRRHKEELKSEGEKSEEISFPLGHCVVTGDVYKISDADVNQGVLILGTTGVGKSVTLRRFMNHALAQGYPLFVIDGKPVPKDISILEQTAYKKSVPFFGFNCARYNSYDPLSHGGPTVMKDKIIALKDYWTSDYYKSLAEDYLQTMIFLLQDAGYTLDFKRLLQGLDIRTLAMLLRQKNKRGYQEELKRLASYGRQDLMGLHIHLSVLANSEIGHFFKSQEQGGFSIRSVMNKRGIGYFALPSLKYPNFAKTLGKLVINDIKASLAETGSSTPIYVVIDEFSVFAGEQVLNIINMGRELGIHSVLATQGLADLVRVSSVFKDQLLNSINLMISHRLNDLGSIEECVRWMGTEKVYKSVTNAMGHPNLTHYSPPIGERPRLDKELLHRHLTVGEAMILSKRTDSSPQRVKVSVREPLVS